MWIGNCRKSNSVPQNFSDQSAERSERLKPFWIGKEHLQIVQSEFWCVSVSNVCYTVVWLSLNIFNIRLTSHSQNTLYIDQTRERLCAVSPLEICMPSFEHCSLTAKVYTSEFKCEGFLLHRQRAWWVQCTLEWGKVTLNYCRSVGTLKYS